MKKIVLHIKTDQTKLPNKMHLEIQQRNPSHVFVPKKGKGSFKRTNKHKNNFDY